MILPSPLCWSWGHHQTIGIFGGSFDPPHTGHRLVALAALKQTRLNQIWFLASPHNPLKKHTPAPAAARLNRLSQLLNNHPKLYASNLEMRLNTRFTIDTLKTLRRRARRTRFVFIMGADNMAGLRRWRGWRQLANYCDFVVYPRAPWGVRARLSPAAKIIRPIWLKGRELDWASGQIRQSSSVFSRFINLIRRIMPQ